MYNRLVWNQRLLLGLTRLRLLIPEMKGVQDHGQLQLSNAALYSSKLAFITNLIVFFIHFIMLHFHFYSSESIFRFLYDG